MNHFCCEDMRLNTSDEYQVVHYSARFDEYGIVMPEDGVSYIILRFCPWCGKRLPESKRDEWYDTLEALGFENPLHRDDIPDTFKSGAWRDNVTKENM